MAKPTKKVKGKGKAPRISSKGPSFDNSALDNLTSTIDNKLGKRKQPPTKGAGDQHQKRQRNSEGSTDDKKSGKIDEKTLLEEIKALGGDESDLALIQGIDSDDEEYAQGSKDSKSVDKGLKDELAALSKQLGFAEVELSEASDEEEEEEEEAEEENEAEDVDDDEDEDEDEVEAPKEAPKKKGNMVGWTSFIVAFLTTNSNTDLRAPRRLACC
jgi:ribosome biogenesis protein MAK21